VLTLETSRPVFDEIGAAGGSWAFAPAAEKGRRATSFLIVNRAQGAVVVFNNPVNWTDPFGRRGLWPLVDPPALGGKILPVQCKLISFYKELGADGCCLKKLCTWECKGGDYSSMIQPEFFEETEGPCEAPCPLPSGAEYLKRGEKFYP